MRERGHEDANCILLADKGAESSAFMKKVVNLWILQKQVISCLINLNNACRERTGLLND